MSAKKVIRSFKYAIEGVTFALKTQLNMRIHCLVAIIVTLLGFYLNLAIVEWAVLLFSMTLVITMELMNTAIEKTIDLITDEYHELAKIAKNVAAAAVLFSALNAVVVGFLIFHNKIGKLVSPFLGVGSIMEVVLVMLLGVGVVLLVVKLVINGGE
ncbi:diacylglycerol kinase family protein [Proteinivorax hydrogeniformans]|uniref:Diacylglycerol kinase family protein n=1 Tax=Proteinivorax hydrogeniformans TaxID=1826727 RepID=A0AAU8HWR2_9FIRM